MEAETRLVRLKAVERRRGYVLRRFTCRGVTFVAGAGWSRVAPALAEKLAGVRQQHGDEHSPLAFDVASEAEARLADEAEARDAQAVRRAADALPVLVARPAVTTPDLPGEAAPEEREERGGRKAKKDKE
jgi:hypothetical protein